MMTTKVVYSLLNVPSGMHANMKSLQVPQDVPVLAPAEANTNGIGEIMGISDAS